MRKLLTNSVLGTVPAMGGARTRTDPTRDRPVSPPNAVVAPQCLIVSASNHHRDWLQLSATSVGWFTVLHREPVAALRESVRRRFHLAVIDCGTSHMSDEFEQLAVDLQSNHVPLLVVSGPENDEAVEIRMRRLGVWSYLSGLELANELTGLFTAAREAAARIDPELQTNGTGESK